jgi:hypothetical protein
MVLPDDAVSIGGPALTATLCGLAAMFAVIGFKCMLAAAHALQDDHSSARPIIFGAVAHGIAACCVRWALQAHSGAS